MAPGAGCGRFRNRQGAAAAVVAAALAVLAGAYAVWDYASSYGQRLHHIQAVDMIFTDIVTRRATAPAQLRALGLPVSWARYAGHYYWDTASVRLSPLYARYTGKLTDGNITHYLLTHPASILHVGQSAAILAQRFRITSLGDYPVYAGHPKGAYESRVVVLTWLMHQLPPGLGLWWFVPLWLAMAGSGRARAELGTGPALAPERRRDGAVHDRVRRARVHPARLLRRYLHHPAHGGDEPRHVARVRGHGGAGRLADPPGRDPGPAAGAPCRPAPGT